MTRAEALALAREHVEKMATNARGYQDGVKFADKVDAVERFARFLLDGEDAAVEVTTMQDADPKYLPDVAYRDSDGDRWWYSVDSKRLHLRPDLSSTGTPVDVVERDYGPLTREG